MGSVDGLDLNLNGANERGSHNADVDESNRDDDDPWRTLPLIQNSPTSPPPLQIPPSATSSTVDFRRRRWLLFGVACIHVIFTAGVVFGWVGLLAILQSRNVFSSLCKEGESGCDAQTQRLALLFVIGTIGNYTSNLPFGSLLDAYGAKVCSIAACVTHACGVLIFLTYEYIGENFLYPGYFLLGFGGPGIQIPTLQFSTLFPGHSGAIMSTNAALFDGSAVIFLLFKLSYFQGVSWEALWSGYLLLILLFALSAGLLWPSGLIEAEPNDVGENSNALSVRSSEANIGSRGGSQGRYTLPNRELQAEARVIGGSTFWSQVCTREWFYNTTFASIHIAHLNFVVGSLSYQLDAHKIKEGYEDLFSSFLPLGFLGLPIVAYLLDKQPSIWVFLMINSVSIIYSLCLIFGNITALLVLSFMAVAVSRQFVYSTVFALTGNLFGFRHYGKHIGVINFVVAIIGVIQYPLISMTNRYADGDYIWANLFFIILTLPLFAYSCLMPKDISMPPVCCDDEIGDSGGEGEGGKREGILGDDRVENGPIEE